MITQGEDPETPWGAKAYVLVGALSHSGKFRCWFSESDDRAHLVVTPSCRCTNISARVGFADDAEQSSR